MTDLVIRNLGGILTGSLDEPVRAVESLAIAGGRIAAIGGGSSAGGDGDADAPARTVDARGAWALAGLWDGSFAIYFGDHEPTYSARGTIAAAVSFGVTTIVAGAAPAVAGWSPDPRADRELAILTARSWRHDRPDGIKVATHVVRAAPGWSAADFAALREAGTRSLAASTGADAGAIRDLAAVAREHGLDLALVLDRPGAVDPAGLAADLHPSFVVLESGDPALVASAAELLGGGLRALGLTLTAGPTAVLGLVTAARDRGALGRVFLGTGLPGAPGVLPGGLGLLVETLAAAGVVSAAEAIALASGNVATALGLEGGRLEIGAPADLSIAAEPAGARDGRRDGIPGAGPRWATRRALTLIDGTAAWRAPDAEDLLQVGPAADAGRQPR